MLQLCTIMARPPDEAERITVFHTLAHVHIGSGRRCAVQEDNAPGP